MPHSFSGVRSFSFSWEWPTLTAYHSLPVFVNSDYVSSFQSGFDFRFNNAAVIFRDVESAVKYLASAVAQED